MAAAPKMCPNISINVLSVAERWSVTRTLSLALKLFLKWQRWEVYARELGEVRDSDMSFIFHHPMPRWIFWRHEFDETMTNRR